ncbi:MAG: TIR domain-containing protein [Clostridia bacterium]|nr:TIR domain-containing protein [Clostridia bacterium]
MNIKPYEGSENFIFVSYAHLDKDQVYPIMDRMISDGYRVWYDEAIAPSRKWADSIAKHIESCGLFIAFISNNYVSSENCNDELDYAKEHKKNRLLIHIEDNVVLSSGMAMTTGRLQAIYLYSYSENIEDFYYKLYSTPGLTDFISNNSVFKKNDSHPQQTNDFTYHSEAADITGYILDNQYQILQNIGGSYSTNVYKALDIKSGNICALKHFSSVAAQTASVFNNKMLAGDLLSYSSRWAAEIYNIKCGPEYYMVQQYIDGKNLNQYLKEQSLQLSASHDEKYVIKQLDKLSYILEALNILHRNNISFGSLNPDNVMIDNNGCCYLIDFSDADYFGTNNYLINSSEDKYISPYPVYYGSGDIYAAGIILDAMTFDMIDLDSEFYKTTLNFKEKWKNNIFSIIQKSVQSLPEQQYTDIADMFNDVCRARIDLIQEIKKTYY